VNQFLHALPNLLSTVRLLLAALFPFCPEREWIWLVLAAGASDFLDGWIARRWHLESWQGGLLDAVADQLFVLSVLVTFVRSEKFSPWWGPGLLARDLAVALIALYASCRREWASFQKMEASGSGKLATAGQFLFFATVVLAPAFIHSVFVIAVLFSLLAAFDYSRHFVLALRQRTAERGMLNPE